MAGMDKLTPEQIERLLRDPALAAALANDADIDRLMAEDADPVALQHLELAVMIGGRVVIGGREYPAPVAAVFPCLEMIGSPFAELSRQAEPTLIDIFRALYLLRHRETVVPQLLRISREQLQLDRLSEHLGTARLTPEAVGALVAVGKPLAAAWAEFDAAVIEWGCTLESFNYAQAMAELQMYLALSGGFRMIPPSVNQDSSKKNVTTPTGSPPSSLWWAKWPRFLRSKLSGACRWRRSAT